MCALKIVLRVLEIEIYRWILLQGIHELHIKIFQGIKLNLFTHVLLGYMSIKIKI